MKRNVNSYKVSSSTKSIEDVSAFVNYSVYHGHGPDWSIRGDTKSVVEVEPLSEYEQLLVSITNSKNIIAKPFNELLLKPYPTEESYVAIRHDVDIDVISALELAKLEHRYGIRSTYFILHTAPYYGEFDARHRFKRYESMARIYLEIQSLGHEIALHTDPLFVYQDHKMDGAEALVEELRWLRSEGLFITGSVSHNSAATYGAVNYAIFKGRPRALREKIEDCPMEAIMDGKWAPLGILEEEDLGLIYEGNEIYWQKNAGLESGTILGVNKWWWNFEANGNALELIANGKSEKGRYLTSDEVLERLDSFPTGKYLELSVHPVYYGCRHKPNLGPTRHVVQENIFVNPDLGWETYFPLTVQSQNYKDNSGPNRQRHLFSNELGLLDAKIAEPDEAAKKILLLGSDNIEGRMHMRASQLQSRLSQNLEPSLTQPFIVRKLAYQNMGISQLFSWYLAIRKEFKPDIVVIGIGTDAYTKNIPELWSQLTGHSPLFPPGDYLDIGQDSSVVLRKKSDISQLFERTACPSVLSANSIVGHTLTDHKRHIYTEYIKLLLSYVLESFSSAGCEVILLIENCGEELNLWKEGSDLKPRKQTIEKFEEWLDLVVDGHRVTVINPYTLISENDARLYFTPELKWSRKMLGLVATEMSSSLHSLLEAEN